VGAAEAAFPGSPNPLGSLTVFDVVSGSARPEASARSTGRAPPQRRGERRGRTRGSGERRTKPWLSASPGTSCRGCPRWRGLGLTSGCRRLWGWRPSRARPCPVVAGTPVGSRRLWTIRTRRSLRETSGGAARFPKRCGRVRERPCAARRAGGAWANCPGLDGALLCPWFRGDALDLTPLLVSGAAGIPTISPASPRSRAGGRWEQLPDAGRLLRRPPGDARAP
jgi:hypothetical protein